MAKRYSRTAFSPSTTVLATWRSKFTCSPSSARQVVVQRRRRRVRVEFFVAQVVATADTFVSQDYDVPLGLSLTPASCVSDYDLLSPYQQPASDVDRRPASRQLDRCRPATPTYGQSTHLLMPSVLHCLSLSVFIVRQGKEPFLHHVKTTL